MLAITMSIDPLMYPASQTSARGLPQPRKPQSTPTVVEVSQASQAKRPMLSASIVITEITPSRHIYVSRMDTPDERGRWTLLGKNTHPKYEHSAQLYPEPEFPSAKDIRDMMTKKL
jgi:hypothetical protein